ncbi:hypothetical protein Tco_0483339 [Tanacetum coccineum]
MGSLLKRHIRLVSISVSSGCGIIWVGGGSGKGRDGTSSGGGGICGSRYDQGDSGDGGGDESASASMNLAKRASVDGDGE